MKNLKSQLSAFSWLLCTGISTIVLLKTAFSYQHIYKLQTVHYHTINCVWSFVKQFNLFSVGSSVLSVNTEYDITF